VVLEDLLGLGQPAPAAARVRHYLIRAPLAKDRAMRRFAEGTAVPVARTRGEVDRLLEDWGVSGIQWTTEAESFSLRFLWKHKDRGYMARIQIKLPSRAELEKEAIDNRTNKPSANKLSCLLDRRGRREHRLLLLWIRAALNAVEAGMVAAEAVFLPFLEDASGRTVAEVALPRLGKLVTEGAERLLPAAR
jgi:hypothetical protein